MNNVYNIFQENKKRNLDHNKKEWKDLVENLDCNIVDAMKGLKEKYEDLIKKHPFMWKTIIETVYPEYLQKELEKIMQKSKYKEKEYRKLKRVIIKDTLVFRESVSTYKENVVIR